MEGELSYEDGLNVFIYVKRTGDICYSLLISKYLPLNGAENNYVETRKIPENCILNTVRIFTVDRPLV